ncbi:uncharacterized protein LOC127562899 isoform X1 [Antechinus flavipes]|uniref:uncharacterized protein LOC127562899 isoform X1 n=1 Tax=Antechinus flavipes TaxID=38775 RepID=UPI0022363C82|nr:uncharacterized protein LOC127562899 isoform X1 [Antechinus flavipes]
MSKGDGRSQTSPPAAVDTKKDLTLPSLFKVPEASHQIPDQHGMAHHSSDFQARDFASLSLPGGWDYRHHTSPVAQSYPNETMSDLDLPVIDQYVLCPDCLRMKAERWGLNGKQETRYQGLPHFIQPTKKMIILDAPKHLRFPIMDFMSDRMIRSKYKPTETSVNQDIEAENVQYRLPMRAIWGAKKPLQTIYTDLLTSCQSSRPSKKECSPEEKNMWAEFNISKSPKHSKFH